MRVTRGNCAILALVSVFHPWLLSRLSALSHCYIFFYPVCVNQFRGSREVLFLSKCLSLPNADFIVLSAEKQVCSSEKTRIRRAVILLC